MRFSLIALTLTEISNRLCSVFIDAEENVVLVFNRRRQVLNDPSGSEEKDYRNGVTYATCLSQ